MKRAMGLIVFLAMVVTMGAFDAPAQAAPTPAAMKMAEETLIKGKIAKAGKEREKAFKAKLKVDKLRRELKVKEKELEVLEKADPQVQANITAKEGEIDSKRVEIDKAENLLERAQREASLSSLDLAKFEIRVDKDRATALLGGNWGVGLGINFARKKRRRAKKASLVNGVVRIDDNEDTKFGPILETHFLFPIHIADIFKKSLTVKKIIKDNNEIGFGPFAAIRFGDDVINAVGGGIMFGLKRIITPESLNVSEVAAFLNVGVGYLWEKDVQVLGNGVREGRPLPPGETNIRFQKKTVRSVLIMLSFRAAF